MRMFARACVRFKARDNKRQLGQNQTPRGPPKRVEWAMQMIKRNAITRSIAGIDRTRRRFDVARVTPPSALRWKLLDTIGTIAAQFA